MCIKLIQDLDPDLYISDIFSLLSQLTDAPKIDISTYKSIINDISNNQFHNIFVYMKNNKPVGMITLLIEQKLIHGGKYVAHIEDLVIDKKYSGQGIATNLLNNVIYIAKKNNCYKIILDCKRELIPFYEKVGFKIRGIRGYPLNPLATLEIRN
jgi:glucosamine-phosphate N-acetyltransferase